MELVSYSRRGKPMVRLSTVTLSLAFALILPTSGLMARGGNSNGHGGSQRPVSDSGIRGQDKPHSNGHSTSDRDFGNDRAMEVGNGEKNGLHKNHKKHKDTDRHENHHDHDKKRDKDKN